MAKHWASVLPDRVKEVTHTQSHRWEVTDASRILLPSNPERLQATFTNTGDYTVYLNFNTDAQTGRGISLMPRGGSYEINLTNPFKGSISAVVEANQITIITGIEGQ